MHLENTLNTKTQSTSEQVSTVPKGKVIWITGLSGAGKSTVAEHVIEQLRPKFSNIFLVDGDLFRAVLGNVPGYDSNDRQKTAHCIARFCKYLSDQGIHVVCATISLFHSCQDWNRENIENYLEVYIQVSMETLIQRDSKKLYSRALAGEVKNVYGVDMPFEAPVKPDIVIENNNPRSDFREVAAKIIEKSGLLK